MRSICCPHFSFCSAWFFLFRLQFSLGGATAAAPKSEAAVDGDRRKVADRVASFAARLGSRAGKLCSSCFPYEVRTRIVRFWFASCLFLSIFHFLRLLLLSFLLRVDGDALHSSRAYAAHERRRPRESGVTFFFK